MHDNFFYQHVPTSSHAFSSLFINESLLLVIYSSVILDVYHLLVLCLFPVIVFLIIVCRQSK